MASYRCQKEQILTISRNFGVPWFRDEPKSFSQKRHLGPWQGCRVTLGFAPAQGTGTSCLCFSGASSCFTIIFRGPGDQCHGLNVTVGETILSLKWKSYDGYINNEMYMKLEYQVEWRLMWVWQGANLTILCCLRQELIFSVSFARWCLWWADHHWSNEAGGEVVKVLCFCLVILFNCCPTSRRSCLRTARETWAEYRSDSWDS